MKTDDTSNRTELKFDFAFSNKTKKILTSDVEWISLRLTFSEVLQTLFCWFVVCMTGLWCVPSVSQEQSHRSGLRQSFITDTLHPSLMVILFVINEQPACHFDNPYQPQGSSIEHKLQKSFDAQECVRFVLAKLEQKHLILITQIQHSVSHRSVSIETTEFEKHWHKQRRLPSFKPNAKPETKFNWIWSYKKGMPRRPRLCCTSWARTLPDALRLRVLTARQCEELFQLPLQSLKRRPFHFVLPPALYHNLIKSNGSTRWGWHAVAILNLVKHLCICHTCSTKTDWFFKNAHGGDGVALSLDRWQPPPKARSAERETGSGVLLATWLQLMRLQSLSTYVCVLMIAFVSCSSTLHYLTLEASLYSLPCNTENSSSFHCKVSNVGLSISSFFQHSSMIS